MVRKTNWYKENIEHVKEYNRQYRFDNPERYLLRKAVNNAQRMGRECTINLEDITIPEVCPVLGIPIYKTQVGSKNTCNDNSPSLDRFDSSKGYTKDNINIMSWKANRLKGSANLEDLRKIVEWMELNSGS